MSHPQPGAPQRRPAPAERKRERELLILGATRQLFDARGVRDALIDDIAKSVGINRAIIYRHFTGKEELFALTQVSYLDELGAQLAAVRSRHHASAADELRAVTATFIDYGIEYPAFVDCGQRLMARPSAELMAEISDSAMQRLGKAMTDCLHHVVETLERGVDEGEFEIDDVHLLANTLYAQGLGGIGLARVGVLMKESAPGVPSVVPISVDRVKDYLVRSAVALATKV